MTIELYILLILIFTMFAFGIIACVGWNKESRKVKEQKRIINLLQYRNQILDEMLAKRNVISDIRAINEEVEVNG